MKKIITLIVFLSSNSIAQEAVKPDWISVAELMEKFNSTEDFSYMSNLTYRCSAFFEVWGAMLARDGMQDLADKFESDAFNMVYAGFAASEAKRGNDFTQMSQNEKIQGISEVKNGMMFELMVKSYINWFTYSYVNYGEYTGDEDLKIELQFCNEVAQITKLQ